MPDFQLAGKKVAVVVESQYIPNEIKIYQERFSEYGAKVDLVSRLWNQPSQTFYSTVEPGVVDAVQRLDVTLDFDQIDLADYAAVVFSANYTSVRLRWSERDDIDSQNAAEVAAAVPAAKFFRKAMQDPRVIKGAACHALWLLTPSPEVLFGRKVICNKVVLADVLNAGAVYTPCAPGTPDTKQVVVDGDLVTNNSWHASAELVDRIAELIMNGPSLPSVRATGDVLDEIAAQSAELLAARYAQLPSDFGQQRPVDTAARELLDGTLDVAAEVRRFTGVDLDRSATAKRQPVLVLASKFGVWASELTLVAGVLLRAGYKVKIATEDGSPPHLLSPSLNPEFLDGSWQFPVVSPAEQELAFRFLNPRSAEHYMLRKENILDLSSHLQKPPQVGEYLKDGSVVQAYQERLRRSLEIATNYDAIVITGGSGAIPGFMFDRGLQSLILAFHKLGKPVMGECNGGLAIAQTMDPATGHSILYGRASSTHSWLDEYQKGWGWTKPFKGDPESLWHDGKFDLQAYSSTEEWVTPGVEGNPLIDSEALFRNAIGPFGEFFSPPGTDYSVVVDENLVSCRTTPDGYPGVLCLIAVMDGRPPLRGRFFIDADECGRHLSSRQAPL